MKLRIVPMPAALLALFALLAALGVGLFVAFGSGSSSGPGESGSRQSVSSFSNDGASPLGAPVQQSKPAATTEITPIDEVPEQSGDPSVKPTVPTAAPDPQSKPIDTAKITPIDEVPEQSPEPSVKSTVPTATPDPDTSLPVGSSRELVVDPTQYRQLLPRDAIAPVYEPRFAPAESAFLAPDALVIGVEINGESKAYPVGPLNFREMVNDTVGGVPVLVSW